MNTHFVKGTNLKLQLIHWHYCNTLIFYFRIWKILSKYFSNKFFLEIVNYSCLIVNPVIELPLLIGPSLWSNNLAEFGLKDLVSLILNWKVWKMQKHQFLHICHHFPKKYLSQWDKSNNLSHNLSLHATALRFQRAMIQVFLCSNFLNIRHIFYNKNEDEMFYVVFPISSQNKNDNLLL